MLRSCVAEFLELTNGGFYGTLPTELGLMTNLKFVFVSKNAIRGTIPSELGNLNNLGMYSDERRLAGSFQSIKQLWLNLLVVLSEKVNFQHTLLSGDMPTQVCDLRDNGRLESLIANCRYSIDPYIAALASDESATVACDCCTLCF